jgi:hypothetical protein
MSLPPANKEMKKNVREMALAFELKSVSRGKGNAKYTTLMKTTRSGVVVDEKKVAKKCGGGGGGRVFVGKSGRRGGNASVPKHREGDEVCGFCFFHGFCDNHEACV